VVQVSGSRWRWLALGYPALTLLAVVVTANHFWLDGIVAALLLALALVVQRAGRISWHWLRSRRRAGAGQRIASSPGGPPSPRVPAARP
jgi:hypothetical protein